MKTAPSLLLSFVLLLLPLMVVNAQQEGDPDFNPVIESPSYNPGKGPLVYVDEAHNNFHTLEGRFAPFANLLKKDGYSFLPFSEQISAESLMPVDILVISNALHEDDLGAWILPNPSAFTPSEIKALETWVSDGGSLLLIADHMPFPGAAEKLAAEFGFRMNNGFAIDTTRQGPIIFSKIDKTLNEHAITQPIDSIASFTGQGFEIPDDAITLLKLPKNVTSLMPDTAWQFHAQTPSLSLAGWSQGAVKTHEKGKVAVFGEAAMFTAQVAGPNRIKVGMNAESAPQNYLFVLRVMKWLAEP